MKDSTIKVKLTSDSYKKWIKWQKNLGELLMRAEQERNRISAHYQRQKALRIRDGAWM